MIHLSLTTVATLVLLTITAQAAEKKISLDKVPKEVMAAVKARFPGAEVTSAEQETEDGQVVYDIELKQKGRHYEMDIKADGTILQIEKEVDAKDLPEAVAKALDTKYPGATKEEIMEVNKVQGKEEKPIEYEVTLVTADKKRLEVTVSLDGKKMKASKPEGDND
jgi:uncharacterized membrane protein YkoI